MTQSLSPSPPRRSIYGRIEPRFEESQGSRCQRRERARARVGALVAQERAVSLDRRSEMQAILRRAREGRLDPCALRRLLEQVREEVEDLERRVAARPSSARLEGATIRLALELLRGFGRLATLDFSLIPDEHRLEIVAWLALEHRWCYAAAGTDRAAFKRATGRTGAR